MLKSKSLMESRFPTQTTVVKYIGAVPVDPNIELEEKYRLRSPVAAPSSTAAAGCWHETTTTTSSKEGDGLVGHVAARFLASRCHSTTSLSLRATPSSSFSSAAAMSVNSNCRDPAGYPQIFFSTVSSTSPCEMESDRIGR